MMRTPLAKFPLFLLVLIPLSTLSASSRESLPATSSKALECQLVAQRHSVKVEEDFPVTVSVKNISSKVVRIKTYNPVKFEYASLGGRKTGQMVSRFTYDYTGPELDRFVDLPIGFSLGREFPYYCFPSKGSFKVTAVMQCQIVYESQHLTKLVKLRSKPITVKVL